MVPTMAAVLELDKVIQTDVTTQANTEELNPELECVNVFIEGKDVVYLLALTRPYLGAVSVVHTAWACEYGPKSQIQKQPTDNNQNDYYYPQRAVMYSIGF